MLKDVKFRRVPFLTAILFSTFAMISEVTYTPAVNELNAFFGDQNSVNLMVSIPMLSSILSSILSGLILMKVKKKLVLLVGCLCFTSTGLLGTSIPELWYMTAMRAVAGIGIGMSNVAALAIIADCIEDIPKRSQFTGYMSAGVSLSGVLLTFGSGLITEYFGWHFISLLHLIGIPMILFIIFFIPVCAPGTIRNGQREESGEAKKKWLLEYVAHLLSQFVWFALYGLVFFQISVLLGEKYIGNAAFAGLGSSVGNLCAFFFCMIFDRLYRRSRRLSALIHYAALAAGLALLYFAQSQAAALVACGILGIGYGNAISYYATEYSVVMPAYYSSIAATTYTFTASISLFLSSYLVRAVKIVIGIERLNDICAVSALTAVAGTLISIFITACQYRRERLMWTKA